MTFPVSILTTGSEILDGRVLDTNSNFVARELSERGLSLARVLAVDDVFDDLVAGLEYLHGYSDLIITSGGLGPTADDLTRDMVAAYCEVGLEEYPDARRHLEEFYAERKRTLDPSNLKQAQLPKGSRMIPNPIGTAPGFISTAKNGKLICALSGVPREFKRMFLDTVLPLIVERSGSSLQIRKHGFRIFGLPESVVGKEVVSLGLPASLTVSYRAAFPEVHLLLKSADTSDALEEGIGRVRASSLLAPYIFVESVDRSLPEVVGSLLLEQHSTVSVAESCTGGLLGASFTDVPGASRYFSGGVLAYDNAIKIKQLGVSADLIATHGAVSLPVARAMACRVREITGTDFGVAVTGIAGPAGGTESKPVGTFFVSVATKEQSVAKHCMLVNDRGFIRRYAAHSALELLRRVLNETPVESPFPAEVKE